MSHQLVPITNAPQRLTFGVQVAFAIISSVAVILRILARKRQHIDIQWDDYLIVIALILSLGLIACDMIGTLYCGVGLHVSEVVTKYGPHRLAVFLKILIPVQILWSTSLAATKCSILLFYCRVFNVPTVQKTAKTIAVIIFLWCLTVILSSFLLCRPFAFNWDQTIPSGVCGNRVLSYIMTGVFNIITDVAVLVLPMPVIRGLHMPTANKVGLAGVFAVGFFVCIISIIRLKSLLTLDYEDITYSVPAALIWSMLEPSLGITLACIPIFKNLIHRAFQSITGSKQSGDMSDQGFFNDRNRLDDLDEYPLKQGGSGSVMKGNDTDSTEEFSVGTSRRI